MSLDNLIKWSEILGATQKNIYNGEIYLIKNNTFNIFEFINALLKHYNILNFEIKLGIKQVYIPISNIRENICKEHRIKRALFDELLVKLYFKNIGRMELTSAPINTSAKNSNYGIRKIKNNMGENNMTLKYNNIFGGQGIIISDRMYHYIAIFEELIY